VDLAEQLETSGYAIMLDALDAGDVNRLIIIADGVAGEARQGRGGVRNLLAVPEFLRFANSREVRKLVDSIPGEKSFPVRGILFDKTPEANWKVPWHQDLSIAVRSKCPTPGYGPWSLKAGVVHVQPPAELLESMLTVRIHLDPCPTTNGPLRVIPGSHRLGRLTAEQIDVIQRDWPSVVCAMPIGGAMIMRPLLLHASSVADSPTRRRVIHLEFASTALPSGLTWT